VLDVAGRGPGVDHPAPGPPAAHALDDVGVDPCVEVGRGSTGSQGVGLYFLYRQPDAQYGLLEDPNKSGSAAADLAGALVRVSYSEIEQGGRGRSVVSGEKVVHCSHRAKQWVRRPEDRDRLLYPELVVLGDLDHVAEPLGLVGRAEELDVGPAGLEGGVVVVGGAVGEL
jgi:hypothetical protein